MQSRALSISWCDPCKKLTPVLENRVKSLTKENQVTSPKLVKINIDDHEDLASEFKVSTIPCLVLIRNGQVIDRIEGRRMNQTNFDQFIKKAVEIGSDNITK